MALDLSYHSLLLRGGAGRVKTTVRNIYYAAAVGSEITIIVPYLEGIHYASQTPGGVRQKGRKIVK